MRATILAFGLLLLPAASRAAAPAEAEAKTEADEGAADDKPKKKKRNLDETRQGSLLKRDKPVAEEVDLRGELERRRDFEIVRHYTRVAELDVIEELARARDDPALAEKVEDVRRKELRRYLAVMQRLRELARAKALQGTP
jgi:hypothetical protein